MKKFLLTAYVLFLAWPVLGAELPQFSLLKGRPELHKEVMAFWRAFHGTYLADKTSGGGVAAMIIMEEAEDALIEKGLGPAELATLNLEATDFMVKGKNESIIRGGKASFFESVFHLENKAWEEVVASVQEEADSEFLGKFQELETLMGEEPPSQQPVDMTLRHIRGQIATALLFAKHAQETNYEEKRYLMDVSHFARGLILKYFSVLTETYGYLGAQGNHNFKSLEILVAQIQLGKDHPMTKAMQTSLKTVPSFFEEFRVQFRQRPVDWLAIREWVVSAAVSGGGLYIVERMLEKSAGWLYLIPAIYVGKTAMEGINRFADARAEAKWTIQKQQILNSLYCKILESF